MAKFRRLEKDLQRELKKATDPKKITQKDLKFIGTALIKAMKASIAKGISPITDGKRFPAYKNPSKYPGSKTIKKKFPKKRKRPVNLLLSGKFLRDLTFNTKKGKTPNITIRFKTKLSRDKEEGHRKGVNKQPKRPIIPKATERFSERIEIILDKLVRKIVDKAFK